MLKKIGINNILILFFFLGLSLFISFPLIFHLTDFATGYGDELITAWVYNWNIYNFSLNFSNIFNIFNANNYFPYHNSLAFSDIGFTNSFLMILPVLILKSPIVANNLTIILSFFLLGYFTYLLSFFITKNSLVSVLSGVLVILCPAYLAHISNLQIISIYLIPLSIIFFLKFLKSKKQMFFYLFLAIFVLQIYNSIFPGYFIFFTSVIIAIFFCLENKKNIKVLLTKNNFIAMIITFCLLAIVALPYFGVSKEFHYVRDIRDSIHLAIQPEDFLSTNIFGYSKFNNFLSKLPFSVDTYGFGEVKPGFLGLTFSILFIYSFFYVIKNWKKQNYIIKGIFMSSILGLVLCLGPFLHIQRLTIHNPFPIPLPYMFFYYLMPGFMGIRNAARFELFFIIFAAPIIAFVLKENLKNIKIFKSEIIVVLLIIFVLFEFNFPMKYYQVPQIKDFPKVYSWLSSTPKYTAIIEMPVYNWNVGIYSQQEFWREYYSTQHFRKTVNGISGFSPFPWQDLVDYLLLNFPSNESVIKLKKIGVNLIIVHKNEYDLLYKNNFYRSGKGVASGSAVIESLKNNENMYLIKKFDEDYVFKIR